MDTTVFRWNKPTSLLEYEKSGGKEGRLFLANECKRLMDPYVPAQNMMLSQIVEVTADREAGHVKYNSPYAHYQYAGIVYVSSVTGSAWARAGEHKVPTDRKLKYSKFRHPLATSEWDKAMLTARRDDLCTAYRNWLKMHKTGGQ